MSTKEPTKSELDAAVSNAIGDVLGEPVHVQRDADGTAWIMPGPPVTMRVTLTDLKGVVVATGTVDAGDGGDGCMILYYQGRHFTPTGTLDTLRNSAVYRERVVRGLATVEGK